MIRKAQEEREADPSVSLRAKRSYLAKHGPSASKDEADLVEILCTTNDPDTGLPFEKEKVPPILSGCVLGLAHDRLIARTQMRSMVLAYLVAAYHTSAVSTSWAIFFVAQYPEVQERIYRVRSFLPRQSVGPQLSSIGAGSK